MGDASRPGLTPAQIELLALLAEEAGEVVHAVGKILRHGYESYPSGYPEVTNRALLESELGDLLAAWILLAKTGEVSESRVYGASYSKLSRVWEYLHHNPVGGARG